MQVIMAKEVSSPLQFQPQNPPQPKPGEWKIAQMYEKAWHILWHFKTLWIFGLASALFGGGFNFNSNFSVPQGFGGFGTTPKEGMTPQSDNLERVLGATTGSFFEQIGALFASVPIIVYVAIGVEVLLLVLLTVAIFLVGRAWASAGLILGTDAALGEKKLTLSEISEKALPKIKPLLWLGIVPPLILVTAFLIVSVLALLLIFFAGTAFGVFKFLVIAILVVCFPLFALALITYSFSLIFAERAVVTDNMPTTTALKTGFLMFRRKIWWTILLGLVNMIVSGLVTIGALIVIVVAVGLVFGAGFIGFLIYKPAGVIVWVLAILMAILSFGAGFYLFGSFINVFKTAVWNQAYHKTKELFR